MPVTDFKVVIPARYASQRLPGKPLEDLGGWPMLRHVWSRAGESGATEVVIATDDERIRSTAEGFGARVLMTDPGHRSGSERIVEVLDHDADPDSRLVVNVQGDEPLLPPALIRQAVALLAGDARADVATLAETIDAPAALFDPAVVKVVLDGQENALYFSRAPIPWSRDAFGGGRPPNLPSGVPYLRHIGLYAYRA
jgi:3-deoxy-manno-octulosonate cytidylyltransferase (CMP-KDO synthetase)